MGKICKWNLNINRILLFTFRYSQLPHQLHHGHPVLRHLPHDHHCPRLTLELALAFLEIIGICGSLTKGHDQTLAGGDDF